MAIEKERPNSHDLISNILMLVKKNQSRKHQNSNSCAVWEYEYPSELFSFATALINGRYPEKQRSVNLSCEEVYYVISGSGISMC